MFSILFVTISAIIILNPFPFEFFRSISLLSISKIQNKAIQTGLETVLNDDFQKSKQHFVTQFLELVFFSFPGTSKKHICALCGRGYKHKSHLTNHLRFECQKDPQFACALCPYKGKRSSSLRSHMVFKHKMAFLAGKELDSNV